MKKEAKLPGEIEKKLKGFERLINHFEDLRKRKLQKLNSFEQFQKGQKVNNSIKTLHSNRKQLEIINLN